jgi:hypothetical protein
MERRECLSGTEAVAMSGGLAFADFAGAGAGSACFGAVCIMNRLSTGCIVYDSLPALVAPNFQWPISGGVPYLVFFSLCYAAGLVSCGMLAGEWDETGSV